MDQAFGSADTRTRMCLLNVSNHPLSEWGAEQMDEALRIFGEVVDMPFPAVDPVWDASQIARLADELAVEIRKIAPRAVHLMGEMTLTHALVIRLKEAGIPCVASTSARQVVDGRRLFRFAGFRAYP